MRLGVYNIKHFCNERQNLLIKHRGTRAKKEALFVPHGLNRHSTEPFIVLGKLAAKDKAERQMWGTASEGRGTKLLVFSKRWLYSLETLHNACQNEHRGLLSIFI